MQTRVSVSLNNASLAAIDSAIVLHAVRESAADHNLSGSSRGSQVGMTVSVNEWTTKDVTVSFAIRIRANGSGALASRAEVLDKVMTWAANGGDLRVNYRSGRHLPVVLAGLAEIDGIDKWTSDYVLTFRAFEVPFWVEDTAQTASVAGTTSGSAAITAHGNAKAPLCFTAQNNGSATCNEVSVSCGGKTIAFSSLGLASGERLELDYINGVQRIRIRNSGGTYRNAYNKRTTESADEILLTPGANTVSVTAGQNCAFTLSTFGRWM